MLVRKESFWDVVYAPFLAHDLTRQNLRDIIQGGLEPDLREASTRAIAGLPFDDNTHTIANENGRIVDAVTRVVIERKATAP